MADNRMTERAGGENVRLIDADALKEKKVYSHERHEKIVPVAEIDWSPTIYAIPVDWLREKIKEHTDKDGWQDYLANSFGLCIEEWQKKQEAR